ncbi:dephospho-CoA kinase [Leptotrichia sp. oral taxon 847]|uniref:dephospho-CoA kinase n=1 Tax=Leptotrichia sp. oral taxon 847 TaxID=1785996 RepID=UPI000B2CFE13|nr:dephospho-CoA kinase [Leptotrichia sp. oral taxon 847]
MIIGITGGIGSGKSTVSRILRNKGFYFVDLDSISHDVIQNPKIKKQLLENFGNEIFDKEEVLRKKLGEIVFKNKKN